MHVNSIITLALGATAVSAAAMPNAEVKRACDPYCQFPAMLDCEVKGVKVTKQELIDAATKDKRQGEPVDASAPNFSSGACMNPAFSGIPLWATKFPPGSGLNNVGVLYYALAKNGTYYYCSNSSAQLPSGWLSSCKETSA